MKLGRKVGLKPAYEMPKCWVREFGFKTKKRSLDFHLEIGQNHWWCLNKSIAWEKWYISRTNVMIRIN